MAYEQVEETHKQTIREYLLMKITKMFRPTAVTDKRIAHTNLSVQLEKEVEVIKPEETPGPELYDALLQKWNNQQVSNDETRLNLSKILEKDNLFDKHKSIVEGTFLVDLPFEELPKVGHTKISNREGLTKRPTAHKIQNKSRYKNNRGNNKRKSTRNNRKDRDFSWRDYGEY